MPGEERYIIRDLVAYPMVYTFNPNYKITANIRNKHYKKNR